MQSKMFVVVKDPKHSTDLANDDSEQIPSRIFDNRDDAEMHAQRLDKSCQMTKFANTRNPFSYSRFDELTSRGEKEIRQLFRKLSIPEPAAAVMPTASQTAGLTMDQKEELIESSKSKAWRDWWHGTMIGGLLSPEQASKVWEAFDLLTFHSVKAIPSQAVEQPRSKSKKAYVIVQNLYEYIDSYYDSNDTLQFAYRSLEDADEACRRLNIEFRVVDVDSDDQRTFRVIEMNLDDSEG